MIGNYSENNSLERETGSKIDYKNFGFCLASQMAMLGVKKIMTNAKSTAWYRQFGEYFTEALGYLEAIGKSQIDPKQPAIVNFERESLAQFIFESNNLEREGLSLGATKELVLNGLDEFPELKALTKDEMAELADLEKNCRTIADDGVPIDFKFSKGGIFRRKNNEILDKASVSLIARYKDKSREALTVVQHFTATLMVERWALETLVSRMLRNAYNIAQNAQKLDDPKRKATAQAFLERNFPENKPPEYVPLFTEEKIKQLHGMLAKDLVDESNAPAGHYRTRAIMTDIESHYPAPEDVPTAMQVFISRFHALEQHDLNPISLASWASTQFVLIHPFPDFNGRVSRLMLNAVFRSYRLPFWISLRSSQKDRRRYFTALKHYREGRTYSITTLVAIQLIKEFESMNKILSLSNYATVNANINPELANLKADVLFKLRWVYGSEE